MPAMPMKDAAERYSPEMADAFQPTDTERPATKKSLAVLEVFAERNPIQTVTTTVMREKATIHGSMPPTEAMKWFMASAFDGLHLVLLQRDRLLDEAPGDDPHEGEKQHAEDQPAQREPRHARRHERRRVVVQQRHAEQCDQEGRGTGDGELQLPAHQRVEKFLAVHPVFVGGRGGHCAPACAR